MLFRAIAGSMLLSPSQKEMTRLRLAQISLRNEDAKKAIEWSDFVSKDIDREGLRQFIVCSSYLLNKDYANVASILKKKELRESSLVDQIMVEKLTNILPELLLK
jgi:hypothetical protein